MTRLALILALVLALHPSAAGAQEAQLISSGDRVRVSTMSGIRLTGRVISLDPKEITFIPDQTMVPTAVARDTITRLEVSQGRGIRKNVLKGALIGAALGVALGFALGDNEGNRKTIGFSVHSAEDKAGVGGVLLGSLGALVGGNFPSERWATPSAVRSPLPNR